MFMIDYNCGGNLLERAIGIALEAHKGQKDRAGFPYILHPLSVMSNVTGADSKIVAVLHDVVEDTDITLHDLAKYGMPEFIIDAVDAITKRNNESYDEYIDRCGKNDMARNVKLSDLAHNMSPSRLKHINKEALERYKKSYNYLAVVEAQSVKEIQA